MGWKLVAFGTVVIIGGALTAAALERTPRIAGDFRLSTTAGRAVTLSALRGKPVVLDFWTSSCRPCLSAIPMLERLHQEYKDRGVQVLGVNVHDTQDPAQTMQDLGASYATLVGGDEVARSYGVEGLPTIIVIDAQGNIIFRENGFSAIIEKRIGETLDKELRRAGE
jgi:thiol-disulfide isomerase/thioredoxin